MKRTSRNQFSPLIAMPDLPRRQFVQGLVAGGLLMGLGPMIKPAWAQRATATAPVPPRFELKVASFPSFDEAVKAAMPLYGQVAPQVQIRLSSLSYADHHSALITALATGTGVADVVAVELSYLGKLIESGGLEDLSRPPYNALALRDKIVGFTFAQASRRDGSLCAMPVDLGPGSLFVRQDIIDRAGVSEAQLTGSWASYIEAGRQIKARTGALLVPNAQTLSDVFIRSNVGNGDGLYFDRADRPLLTTPRFERAFALARSVRAAGLDGRFTPFTAEWAEGFKRGTFATEMSGAWLAGQLARYIAPKASGLWRALPLPEGAFAAWGGSFYAIPKSLPPERKARAWDFIRFMATNLAMQITAFKQVDAYPALLAAGRDPFMEEPIAYLGGQRARLLWRNAADHIPSIEINKFDPIATEVLGGELDKVLEFGKNIKAALSDAQRKVLRRVRR